MAVTSRHPRSFPARIFISPEEPRLRAGWRLTLQSLLLFALVIVFSLPVELSFYLKPLDNPYLQQLLSGLATLIAITLSVYLARRWFDRRKFSSLGLLWDRQAGRDFTFGLLAAGVMLGLVFVLELAFGWLQVDGFAWQTAPPLQTWYGLLVMLLVFVAVGWQEELLSRGYWLQNLTAGLNLFWGVLISSLLFAVSHLANPNFSWLAVGGLLLAGLFLAFAYLRTGQLWLSIGLHVGWNFFEGPIFGFPVSGLTGFPVVISQNASGPELITGGNFGPEAGLILLPGMAVGFFIVWWYTRQRVPSPSVSSEHS